MAVIASSKNLVDIVSKFPRCAYAFAYGSAVFEQKGQTRGRMTDIVLVVDDPIAWHNKNIEMNWTHYSSLRHFGPKTVTTVQEKMATGVYYNPFVVMGNTEIKYGVISTKTLITDLEEWIHIYIAGRLHKPVLNLSVPTAPDLVEALRKNRNAALTVALLQHGRTMTKEGLYRSIAEISYLGDFRMHIAEDPNKVNNIVTPLIAEFDKVYIPHMASLTSVSIDSNDDILQDTNPRVRFSHLMSLPRLVQQNLSRRMLIDPRFVDIEEAMAELSFMPNIGFFVRASISDIVRRSSISQTLQGIISAGALRAIRYGYEKLKKKLNASKVVKA